MGLDWVIDRKPIKGKEVEFEKLLQKIYNSIDEDEDIIISSEESIDKNESSDEDNNESSDEDNNESSDEDNTDEDNEDNEEYEETYKDYLEKKLKKISISSRTTGKNSNFKSYYSSGYFLDSELLEPNLIDEACENHTALGCIDYANKLELNLSVYDKYNLDEEQLDDYESIIEAIEWLKFWGNNGHGFSCNY